MIQLRQSFWKKSQILRDFQGQICKKNLPFSGEFCVNLCDKLHQNTINKKGQFYGNFQGKFN